MAVTTAHHRPPRLLLDAVALVLSAPLAALSCAGSDAKVEVVRPPQPLQIVAVTPVRVSFAARPAEALRQTLVLLDLLWSGSAWGVITPEEFTRNDPSSTDFLHTTNLVVVTHDLGIDPKRFGVLSTSLTAREAHGQAVVAGDGKVAVGRDYEGYLDAQVELLSADGHRVASATATVSINPFADRPDNDDAPWVRAALEKATKALLQACQGCVADLGRPRFHLYTNPAVLLEGAGKLSVPAHELDVDRVEREQQLWRLFQFFDPRTSLDDARRLAAVGPSVCIGPDAPLPLEPGDCILSLGGARFTSPHALLRALKGGKRVMLDVVDTQGTRRSVNGLDLLP